MFFMREFFMFFVRMHFYCQSLCLPLSRSFCLSLFHVFHATLGEGRMDQLGLDCEALAGSDGSARACVGAWECQALPHSSCCTRTGT